MCVDERYFRPTEVDQLCGDASRAHKVLGWQPKVGLSELVNIMVDADEQLLLSEMSGLSGLPQDRYTAFMHC